MTRNILFIMTGAGSWTLNDGSSHKTGFWAEEAVAPLEVFRNYENELAAKGFTMWSRRSAKTVIPRTPTWSSPNSTCRSRSRSSGEAQPRRGDIFVDTTTTPIQSSVRSGTAEDVAPTELNRDISFQAINITLLVS